MVRGGADWRIDSRTRDDSHDSDDSHERDERDERDDSRQVRSVEDMHVSLESQLLSEMCHGAATSSRLLKIIGLFCKRAL